MQIPGSKTPLKTISFYNQRNAPYCTHVSKTQLCNFWIIHKMVPPTREFGEVSVGWWPFSKIWLFIANHEVLKEKKDGNPNVSSCVAFFSDDGCTTAASPFPTSFGGPKGASQKKNPTNTKNEDPMGFS